MNQLPISRIKAQSRLKSFTNPNCRYRSQCLTKLFDCRANVLDCSGCEHAKDHMPATPLELESCLALIVCVNHDLTATAASRFSHCDLVDMLSDTRLSRPMPDRRKMPL